MNISDEELKQFADIDPEAYMEILSPLLAQANVNMVDEFDGFRKIQEMAQELLRRRQSDRAIWENAPERANWFARDADGMGFYYSEEPERGLNGWSEGGEFWPMRDDGWQSALQERPK